MNPVHVLLALDFVIMLKFLKDMHFYGYLVEECFANTKLSDGNLHGSYFGTVLTDRNELTL